MIQLLALERDAERLLRVEGDTFCKMFIDVKLRHRKIKLDREFFGTI